MQIIYNLLLIFLFSAIFALSIFIIEKVKTTSWFINIKIINSTKLLIEGSIYGVLFLGVNILFRNMSNSLIAFYLIGFFILVAVKETTISVIAIIPATLYYLFTDEITTSTYFVYGTMFAMAISFNLAIFFSNNLIARNITYSIFLAASLIIWLIASYLFDDVYLYEFSDQLLFTVIGSIIGELIIFWFLKTSVSANVLYESINYSFSKYYRSQLKNQAIGDLIKNEKVKKALYIVFNIHVDSLVLDEIHEVTETILKDLETELPDNTIFFQGEDSRYGAYLPVHANLDLNKLINDNYDYKAKDNLDFLRNILNKFSTAYRLKNKSIVNASVSAGISIYGIQSYSLHRLESNATFMLDYIKDTSMNPIAIFDPMEYHKRKKEANDLLILNDALDLSSLKLSFSPIYGTENINIAEFYSINEEEYIRSISEYTYAHGLIDVYNRYLSASALIASKEFKGRIAIPYPFEELKELEINRFIKRIDLLGSELKKIVFIFHGIELSKDKDAKKKMESLREKGAKIAFISIEKNQKNLVNYFKPDFVFTKYLDDANIELNPILINIENESQLEKAIEKGITRFSGSVLSSKSEPHILSKQSKIYIEEKKIGGKHE